MALVPDPLQVGIIRSLRNDVNGKAVVKIRKLFRPENTTLSNEEVRSSDYNLLFWTDEEIMIDADRIEGKVVILPLQMVSIRYLT